MSDDTAKVMKLNANVWKSVQVMLMKIATTISNTAKVAAPYLSGTLRRSISIKTNRLAQGTVVVGAPVAYARRREFENNAHPERKYYLRKWYELNRSYIREIVKQTFDKVLNSDSTWFTTSR